LVEAFSDPVADRRSLQPAFRSCAALGRRRTGLLGLMVTVSCGVPGVAMASTFTGDPLADGWTPLGNSSDTAFYVRGTNKFNIFTTSFVLESAHGVSLTGSPFPPFPQGDAFLYGGPTDSWKVGDKILGLGISGWESGAGGYPTPAQAISSGLFYVKFDPAGTGVFDNAVSGKFANDGSIYQSPGSFGFDFNRGTQNSSSQASAPYQPYQTFELQSLACPTAAPCSSTSYPYGGNPSALASNGNNLSTTGAGTLPMRAFGLQAGSETSWSSFEIFINTSLLPAEAGTFGDNSKFSFSAWSFGTAGLFDEAAGCLNPSGCTAPPPAPGDEQPAPGDNPTAAPGPLPLLGVGAAFGYSRRLRRRIKSTGPSV
jgi:hypothetical protein